MRVPIPHDIGKEEVRRRLHARSHEIGQFVPGGVADVQTAWPNEDRMDLSVTYLKQVSLCSCIWPTAMLDR